MEIEFTDRYGGRMPSWLRACHGQCEAMGAVPIKKGEREEPWATLWAEAETAEPTNDGWHFVTCPECHGTGRVGWLTTVLRVPIWFWKGFASARELCPIKSPHTSWASHIWLVIKCAWLYDIANLRN